MRGKVIVSEREGDSFKSWGQECSSASQGHRYFMAFTFLHDKLMPRIDRVVLGKKRFNYRALKTHPNISSLFLCSPSSRPTQFMWQTSGSRCLFFLLLARACGGNRLKCGLLFGISSFTHFAFYKVLFNLLLIYRGLFPLRSLQTAGGSLHGRRTPQLTPRSYTVIPHRLHCEPRKLLFYNVTTFNQH